MKFLPVQRNQRSIIATKCFFKTLEYYAGSVTKYHGYYVKQKEIKNRDCLSKMNYSISALRDVSSLYDSKLNLNLISPTYILLVC